MPSQSGSKDDPRDQVELAPKKDTDDLAENFQGDDGDKLLSPDEVVSKDKATALSPEDADSSLSDTPTNQLGEDEKMETPFQPEDKQPQAAPESPGDLLSRIEKRMKEKTEDFMEMLPKNPFSKFEEQETSKSSRFDANTGMRIALSWYTQDDLDLHVKDPSGEVIFYQDKRSDIGGSLDLDANAESESVINDPVETISWSKGSLIKGEYSVVVDLYAKRSNKEKIPYTLTIWRSDKDTQVLSGYVDAVKHERYKEVKKENLLN